MVTPLPPKPSSLAAPSLRSRICHFTEGPRSLTSRATFFPVARSVTLTTDPRGRLRWAHVIACGSKRSPLAVSRPACHRPYQDAAPTWTAAGPRVSMWPL